MNCRLEEIKTPNILRSFLGNTKQNQEIDSLQIVAHNT